jgi:hypothetical protein
MSPDEAATVESRWLTSMGTIASILPHSVNVDQPPADIVIRNQLRRGVPLVVTLVTITNRSREAQRMSYIYQDAAYMWFPDGDQRNVESIRIGTSRSGYDRFANVVSAGVTAPGFWQFAGTFNRQHGVVAGLLSMNNGEVIGISGEYVGITTSVVDGAGRFHNRSGFHNADIPRVTTVTNVRTQPFINRFIALDFGEMQPDQQKTLSYFRIMTVLPPEQRTEDGIQAWVAAQVTALYQRTVVQNQGSDAAQ